MALWLALLGAPQAQAVTLGSALTEDADNYVGCGPSDETVTYIQTALPGRTLIAPFSGVITRWGVRLQTSNTGYGFQLEVMEDSGTGSFSRVRQSEVEVPTLPFGASTQMFPARIPIEAGQQTALTIFKNAVPTAIGVFKTGSGQGALWCPRFEGGPSAPAYPFSSQLLMNARVEPDADGDGYGDETQDGCPTNPARQDPCPSPPPPPLDRLAPNTAITKGPTRLRTQKKRVTARFAFQSSELATWECRLGDEPWRSCSSPTKRRLRASRKGRTYSFQVRATDSAGNVEPEPAVRKFKVKRIRKR